MQLLSLFLGCQLGFINDGICNDENNVEECNYDGGDCCGSCINTDNCTECLCHNANATDLDLSCKLMRS